MAKLTRLWQACRKKGARRSPTLRGEKMYSADQGTAPVARLPKRHVFGYGLMEMPLSMAATPMALFIVPFYTRDLGLSLAAVGTILMLARISDVLTDPLIGQLSDRTRTRLGRRKPWILFGAPLLMASIWMLFAPTSPVTNFYFGFWLVTLWLGWTLMGIPFYALGAELSPHYHERTRIASVRTGLGVLGTLIAIVVPLLSGWWLGYGYAIAESLHVIAVLATVALLAAVVLLWQVPEGAPIETRRISMREGLRVMWSNGPFRRLMIGFTLAALGPAIGAPLYILFVVHVLEANVASNLVLLVFYVANLIGVVLWGAVARRFGKRNAWLMGMFTVLVAQPGYWFLGPGDLNWMMIVFFILGIGIGSFTALPAAMKADVVDLDRIRSGEDRTGLFFSVWSLATKLVIAFAAGLVLNLLALFDFQATGTNGPEQINALRVIFIFLPVFFYVIAFLVMWNYPISEARHKRLIEMLQRRSERRARAARASGTGFLADLASPRARS
jgi:glycoside/pentoside/hexuronide:cation symporter, GPH family